MEGSNMNYNNKKKAFTLIELLIVIAIIGILFIVLVSKVDFAADKAKATGVQTDFRSFQMALETVSKEKAGFNSFGWNTGDANANGVRDSVDEGDANEDGIYQDGETWTGHKKYLETWTNTYSLIRPGTTFEADGYDKDAIFALETAINKNLDPKLHITIDAKTGLITMANGAQDPWNTQYHGAYISAEDGMDRGAIVMYSNGANQKFGSEHDIANGVPTVIVPGNNKDGADDYSLVVCYTYTNGFGEVGALTTGFSNNQAFLTGNGGNVSNGGNVGDPGDVPDDDVDLSTVAPGLYVSGSNYKTMTMSWQEILDNGYLQIVDDGRLWNGQTWYNDPCAGTDFLVGDLVLPNDGSIKSIGNNKYQNAFGCCYYLTNIILPDSITEIPKYAFYDCRKLQQIKLNNNITAIGNSAFTRCRELSQIIIPESVQSVGTNITNMCFNLAEVVNLSPVTTNIPKSGESRYGAVFNYCTSLEDSKLTIEDGMVWLDYNGEMWLVNDFQPEENLILPDDYHGKSYNIEAMAYYCEYDIKSIVLGSNINIIEYAAFSQCSSLVTVQFPKNLKVLENSVFMDCINLKTIVLPDNIESLMHMALSGSGLEEIIIPETVTYWEYGTFSYCSSLKRVTIKNASCTLDRGSYFSDCTLDNLYFDDEDVLELNAKWFGNVTSIKTLSLSAAIPPVITNGTLSIPGLEAIYVPAESVELYKTAEGWSAYATVIQPIQ